MPSITEVEKLAFDLPDSERAVLAAHLLGSLPPTMEDADDGVAEALRRDAELDTNPQMGISLERASGPFSTRLMRISLHPQVSSDVQAIMEYYRRVAGPALADESYCELRQLILQAAERPGSFAVRERDLRRANLPRFPYHFLFRAVGETVRVLVVRHHRKRPSFGSRRL